MDTDQIQDATNWLMNLGAVPFTVVACVVIGYVFRAIPKFPNKWIPIVVILSGQIFLLVNPKPTSVAAMAFYAHGVIGGFFIGLVAWLLHDKFASQFEDKLTMMFPKSAIILTSTADDGTKTFVKTPTPVTPAQPTKQTP